MDAEDPDQDDWEPANAEDAEEESDRVTPPEAAAVPQDLRRFIDRTHDPISPPHAMNRLGQPI